MIEKFFGFPTGVGGGELTWLAQLQAYRFGAKFSTPSQALSLNYDADGEYRVCLETEGCSAILRAKTVLIATGADYRRLNAEGREQFENMGVYYAATAMEGQLCRNETVVIAGSGNSAGQAAMFFPTALPKCYSSFAGKASPTKCRTILHVGYKHARTLRFYTRQKSARCLAEKSSNKSSSKIRRLANAEWFKRRLSFP